MWRTRCARLTAAPSSAQHATDVSRLHFDAVVVGAGTSGCLVAGRLAMENIKTLVIEEGADIRRQSEWHWTLPCSMLEHRFARRGYESDDTDTVPQRAFHHAIPSSATVHVNDNVNDTRATSHEDSSRGGSSTKSTEQDLHDNRTARDKAGHSATGCRKSASSTSATDAASSDAASGRTDELRQVVVRIPTPRVLGGHGVMGSRCWGYGDERDWDDTPWSFRDELLPHLRLFENPDVFVPHRGRRGRFTMCHGATFSPYYKAFCESIAQDVPLVSHLMRCDYRVSAGCGRTDLLVDPHSGQAHSTLQRYLLNAIKLQRPVRVECGSRVVAILGHSAGTDESGTIDANRHRNSVHDNTSNMDDTNGKNANTTRGNHEAKSGSCSGHSSKDSCTSTAVCIRRADGTLVEVSASIVVVCAGAIGSARLLHASRGCTTGLRIPAAVGTNFWDVPQVVLQYRSRRRDSHNCFADAMVRLLLRSDLMMGKPRRSLLSSWDDLILYGCSSSMDAATFHASHVLPKTNFLPSEPDVEIIFQPFTLCSDGTQPIPGEHGCQFIVRPLRPRSRGVIAPDGSIDPNYLHRKEDLIALQCGVNYVKKIVHERTSLRCAVCDLIAERFESAGLSGGSCFPAIEPSTFRLNGVTNVYVCGSSILPHPLSGPITPYTIVMADRFVDSLLRKHEVREKRNVAAVGDARIVY